MSPRLLPEAEEELAEVVDRYENEEPGLGLRFAAAFNRSVDRLKGDPSSWPIVVGEFRRCRIFEFPYDIFFAADGSETVIVAVAHHHRRPNYWRGRWPTRHD